MFMGIIGKHNTKRTLRTRTIKSRIIAIMLAFLLPLIILLLVYNFYTVGLLRDKTALSNKNTLLIYSDIVEKSLMNISSQMLDAFVYESNYYRIRNSTRSVDRYLATYKLTDQLQKSFASGSSADMFFVLTGSLNNVIFNSSSRTNYDIDIKISLREALWDFVSKEDQYEHNQWNVFIHGGQTYLVKIYGGGGVYVGAAINLDNLTFPLTQGTLFDDYRILFTTTGGQPLTQLDFINKNGLDLTPSEKNYTLSGFPDRYLILNVPLKTAPICMIAVIKDPTFLTTLNTIQLTLFFASTFTIFLIPIAMLLIRKSIIKPVNTLVETMERIRSGDFDSRPDIQYSLAEFKKVNDTFSQLMDEIGDLKIEAYEEQLAKHKAELQYLQFQIRPHFFLNSLKLLYSMAQNNITGEIKQLIMALSNHFRYMFKDNFTLVKLRDELSYIKNYIQIQQIYTSRRYSCEINIEEQLLDLPIPPISIQTFVENSILHAVQDGKTLKIYIRARMLVTDEGSFASITVTDNGPGFSRDMLDLLNFQEPQNLPDGHVGLANVLQRLKIIYPGQAHVAFTNSVQGGAVCEMIIPAGSKESSVSSGLFNGEGEKA